MPGFIASYDQMTAVANGRKLRFVFDFCTDCEGCAMSRGGGYSCDVRETEPHGRTLCGSSREDGRNGRWKEAR